jgi:pectate lyase
MNLFRRNRELYTSQRFGSAAPVNKQAKSRFRATALAVAGMLTVGMTSIASAVPLLSSNFESGTATGWTPTGTWSIVTDGSKVYKNTYDAGLGVSSAGSSTWTDYAVEARVKPLTWNGTARFISVFGRYTDSSNSYFVVLRSSNVLELKKVVAGSSTLITSKAYTVTAGNWYTVKLTMVGSSLKVAINGTQELAATDTQFASGKIAIGTSYATGQFDDVDVREVPVGYGAATTGGYASPLLNTQYIEVDTAQEFKDETRRNYPQVVQVVGDIDLTSLSTPVVTITSNKTIIGKGSSPSIKGTIRCNGISNVIIQDLEIKGVPPGTANYREDGVGIFGGSTNIWVDHCTFTDTTDGAVDITERSNLITVSWCKFQYPTGWGHQFPSLIGNNEEYNMTVADQAGYLNVTMHHNWYAAGCQERMPNAWFGNIHVFNNYYNAAGNAHTVNTRTESEVRLENSYFYNMTKPWVATGVIQYGGSTYAGGKLNKGTGNILDGTTDPYPTMGFDTVFTPPYSYNLQTATDAKNSVIAGAGCRL